MTDTEAGVPARADDEDLATPNCVACLHPMRPAETRAGSVHWSCPRCGQVRIL